MAGRGCRPLHESFTICIYKMSDHILLSTVVTTPTHRTPVKWNQSNFFSDQKPSPCPALLELKWIFTLTCCLQKGPGKDPWLLVVEIGFWANRKVAIIVKSFSMFEVKCQPKLAVFFGDPFDSLSDDSFQSVSYYDTNGFLLQRVSQNEIILENPYLFLRNTFWFDSFPHIYPSRVAGHSAFLAMGSTPPTKTHKNSSQARWEDDIVLGW